MFDKLPIPVMKGATAGAAGKRGRVPAPAAGDHGKYLRGDGTWATGAVGGDMVAANNLSDLADKRTARINLGTSDEGRAPRPGIISAGTSAVGATQDNAGLAFGTGDLTIGAWLRLPDWTPASQQFVFAKSNLTTLGVIFRIDSGFLMISLGTGSSFNHYLSSAVMGVTDGSWAFIAATLDRDGNVVYYLNGTQLGIPISIAALSAQTQTSPSALYWGANGNGAGPITGTIGETFIVGGVLTAARIAEIYKAGSIAPFCAYTANSTTGQNTATIDTFSFFQWCDFGQGYGPIIKDRSGNNQHALMGTTGLTHAVTRNPPGIPQRAPRAGIMGDGGSGNFVRSTLGTQNPGTGELTFWIDSTMPTNSGNDFYRALAYIGSSSSAADAVNSLLVNHSGAASPSLGFTLYGDLTGNVSQLVSFTLGKLLLGRRFVLAGVRSASGFVIHLGLDGDWHNVTSLFATASTGTPPSWATANINGTYLVGLLNAANSSSAATLYDLRLANVALTEAQLRTEYERGEPGPEWSAGTKTQYTSDFSAGVNGWGGSAGTTAGNVDGIGGRDDVLRYYAGSSTGAHVATGPQLVPSAQYKVTLDVYLPSTNTTAKGLWFSLNAGGVDGQELGGYSRNSKFTITDTWTTITGIATASFATGDAKLGVWTGPAGSGLWSYAGANSATDDVVYVRNVTIERLGYTSRLRTDTAAGLTAINAAKSSTNDSTDFLLSTTSVTTSPNGRTQIIRANTNTNGNQQLFGTSVIDTSRNWRIRSWHVVTTGTPTISLGSASGGAQYVSALALSASILTDITLLARYALSANLWCASNSTATVNHVIILDLVD
jgi:hypothetical protein